MVELRSDLGKALTDKRVERRLAAVLAADVAGYSRLMGADEEGTLGKLKALRKALFDPKIVEHRGRIVKTTGDGMLVEFASAVCGEMRGRNSTRYGYAKFRRAAGQQDRISYRHSRR